MTYASPDASRLVVHRLGLRPYRETESAMRAFTAARDAATADEIWLLQHPQVFTQGQAGRAEHLLAPGDIEVVATDRGGQVTHHGPGQIVAYLLLDLRRRRLFVRDLVCRMEQATIDTLASFGVAAQRHAGAPGVYISPGHPRGGAKIASLGLKVAHGCTYHGLALNVAMDLEPFSRIDPCGLVGQQVTDLAECGVDAPFAEVEAELERCLTVALGVQASCPPNRIVENPA